MLVVSKCETVAENRVNESTITESSRVITTYPAVTLAQNTTNEIVDIKANKESRKGKSRESEFFHIIKLLNHYVKDSYNTKLFFLP